MIYSTLLSSFNGTCNFVISVVTEINFIFCFFLCLAVVAAVSHVQPIVVADDEDETEQHNTPPATGMATAPGLPDEALLSPVLHDPDHATDILSPPAFPPITGHDTAMVDDSTVPAAQPAATADVVQAVPTARTPQLPKARRSKGFTPSQERKCTKMKLMTYCINLVVTNADADVSCFFFNHFRVGTSYREATNGAKTAAATKYN